MPAPPAAEQTVSLPHLVRRGQLHRKTRTTGHVVPHLSRSVRTACIPWGSSPRPASCELLLSHTLQALLSCVYGHCCRPLQDAWSVDHTAGCPPQPHPVGLGAGSCPLLGAAPPAALSGFHLAFREGKCDLCAPLPLPGLCQRRRDPEWGCHQLPAAAYALRHRQCRRPHGPGHPGGVPPPR